MNEPNLAILQERPRADLAVLRHGFRPFFLGAGIWAVVSLAIWLGTLAGVTSIPSAFDPLTWHVHEMVFGYAAAVVAGFFLTAIPNWTGRMPLRGGPLGLLFLLWVSGRIAVAFSEVVGTRVSAVIDVAFLVVLLVIVVREILAGRNWRNVPMVMALAVLLAGNVMTHLEALEMATTAALGHRLAIGAIVLLITLVGGRIVPSFTRNWLANRGAPRLPSPFGAVDRLAIAATLVTVVCWAITPDAGYVSVLALGTALIGIWRLARWQGHRTSDEPLVWILHLGYAWVPVGFALIAAESVWPIVPSSSGLHALTIGAIGTMTLAVMTRATLGHTGRPLAAGLGTTLVYVLITLAAITRVLSPVLSQDYWILMNVSGLAWLSAFSLFVAIYGPKLLRPRADGNAG